jgi:hypothetical protein
LLCLETKHCKKKEIGEIFLLAATSICAGCNRARIMLSTEQYIVPICSIGAALLIYGKNKMKAFFNKKTMSSTMVRGQYPVIGIIFDPP